MVARIEPIIKGGMFMIKYDDEFRKHSYTKGFIIIHAMTIIIHAMRSIENVPINMNIKRGKTIRNLEDKFTTKNTLYSLIHFILLNSLRY
jgi:hypothetical protein